ncbi:aldehyde dehydrogenase (NADP(+)) [Paracoccus fistulariae]|uniref:Aldehyde dehydrogenase (NADP(+)) n=1 Tax=Paracoccus fistulariae TaxID=658446 RepID=A0ABY7SRG0_9RHOB|nr:aldehyde dehydrogenase (NADP(+)) [Paracoccus fistulariae]MDB6182457.1 aldehyde dehydrogenase (NADP(+)) [Paracoccus fistulariae]WCR08572.1 aldehyde dehydrogenase (NADP(+)) [Paracoccus fistulariae]
MTYIPKGKHLIAGEWIGGDRTFRSAPAHGPVHDFASGQVDLVNRAADAAEQAFEIYAHTTREERAAFLEAIADEIDARGDQVTEIGTQETALPEGRLQGERGRTTGQLRLFAQHIRDGAYLDRRHDGALPDRQPPRPDLRLIQRPIGPVAVFGASNFPLAFSTAGGDTASALAAGCPVIVKGHPAHPGTGEIIAEAIHAAIQKTGMPAGVFSFIHGDTHEVGKALVEHPLIKAVGFTGSLRGGRALFDLCAARPEPIPFFGELGSINPCFVLPAAMQARSAAIAEGWVGSLTLFAGQFCTNPGLLVLPEEGADAFAEAAARALEAVAEQVMLTDGMAQSYRDGAGRVGKLASPVAQADSHGRNARPNVYRTGAEDFLRDHTLGEEVFGPMGLIVTTRDADQMIQLARGLEGQLTATLQMDDGDTELAARLMPVLERKAGRVLANGWPTGVEVADAMVHGGPYPASTNFGATSVGTMAIRRFLRPVSYQNIPEALLPPDLRGM